MSLDRKIDHQTRGWLLAIGGSAIVAAAAMFVPVGLWETLTGSTGLSEMIPATAAPLGDRARALISFGLGAITLILLVAQASRRPLRSRMPEEMRVEPGDTAVPPVILPKAEGDADHADARAPSVSLVAQLRAKWTAFVAARRDGKTITTLEDLPKLRASDAHPDAPARHPFSAVRELAEPTGSAAVAPASATPLFASEVQAMASGAPAAAPPLDDEPLPLVDDRLDAAVEAELIEAAAAAETAARDDAQTTPTAQNDSAESALPAAPQSPTIADRPDGDEIYASQDRLTDMVHRLEAALDARSAELQRIEALALELTAARQTGTGRAETADPIDAPFIQEGVEAAEAVEAEFLNPDTAGDIDPALRSALETLYRTHSRMH